MHGNYGLAATNMVFITLIQALCQQSFGLTLPQICVSPLGPQKAQNTQSASELICVFLYLWWLTGSRAGGRGGFLVQFRLFVWIQPREEVKSLTRTDHPEESERVPQHFPRLQARDLRLIRPEEQP